MSRPAPTPPKARKAAPAAPPGDATRPVVWKGAPDLRPLLRPVEDLHEDPANTNTHDERSIATLSFSYDRFGQQKPVVADAKGIVRDGNGQLRAAAMRLGWTHLAVSTSDLEGAELVAYAIAANRTATLSSIDREAELRTLRALQSDHFDLAAIGYKDTEADAIAEALARDLAGPLGTPPGEDAPAPPAEATDPDPDPGPQPDRADALNGKWQVEPGQLWIIPSLATPGADHRLYCGDSTRAEDLARLMDGLQADGAFTSPPYAEQRKGTYGGTPADRYVDWWEPVQANVRAHLKVPASFFLNIKAHVEAGERDLYVMDLVLAMRRRWGWRYVDELCWERVTMTGTWPDRFKNGWEPVHQFSTGPGIPFFPWDVAHPSKDAVTYNPSMERNSKSGSGLTFSRDKREGMALPSNVLKTGSANGNAHPAAFPPALPTFFLKAYSAPGAVWLEPFAGSGTTIVAAEETGRLGHGLERHPPYCAVILERLQGLGLKPRLVDATARPGAAGRPKARKGKGKAA